MDSARCSGPYEEIPNSQGTNQIVGFVEFRPLTSRKKDNTSYFSKREQIIPFNPLFRKRLEEIILSSHCQTIGKTVVQL